MEAIRRDHASPILEPLRRRMSAFSLSTSSPEFLSAFPFGVYNFDSMTSFSINKGVIEVDESLLVEVDSEGTVVADLKQKKLLRVDDRNLSKVRHNEVVNLNEDGERWEGDVLDETPFGWGVLYDKNNNMVYEGFRTDEWNVCFGRKYYADIGVIEYEGELCESMRWGHGTQYDRHGEVVFEGQWMNDSHILSRQAVITREMSEDDVWHNGVEELRIGDSVRLLAYILSFRVFPQLRVLSIGNESLCGVVRLRLVGMKHLEKVTIGDRSFTNADYNQRKMLPCEFVLKNCPVLKELSIGNTSFVFYSVCVIENVPQLESIQIGTMDYQYNLGSFQHASLELRSCVPSHPSRNRLAVAQNALCRQTLLLPLRARRA